MAARQSLDDKLAVVRGLRGQALTEEQRDLVRRRLGDRSNLAVAAAAAIAGENALVELAPELVAAFDRFLVEPLRDDRLCRAKQAIVVALDRMEHMHAGVFHRAARHVQMEPVWGGAEDSAPPLRAAALMALARVEGKEAFPTLVDAMVDPAKEVRMAAALAIGAVGTEGADLVLRLKARVGDPEPDVLSECLGAMLAVNPARLAFVSEFLNPDQETQCEAAAMALGRSRLADAVEPLRDCWERTRSVDLRAYLLLAIAILRRPAALDLLEQIVAAGAEPDALAALAALRIYREEPRVRERVAEIVRKRGDKRLQAAFDREFA